MSENRTLDLKIANLEEFWVNCPWAREGGVGRKISRFGIKRL